MATKKESAPGPDGIPYSLHRCAVGLGAQFLFNTNKHVLEVVLSLRYLPKAEMSLFPSPLTSTTLDGL